MITKHLNDQERDQFAACGCIVIDGEPCKPGCDNCNDGDCWLAPEGWRILTVECDGSDTCPAGIHIIGCYKSTPADEANEFVGMLPVFTLTATCPVCSVPQDGRVRLGMELCERCKPGHWEFCSSCQQTGDDDWTIEGTPGVATLGRFTLSALLPVGHPLDPLPAGQPWFCASGTDYGYVIDADGGARGAQVMIAANPGQFVARPEAVA